MERRQLLYEKKDTQADINVHTYNYEEVFLLAKKYFYCYLGQKSSLSSCRPASTDLPYPLLLPVSIVHYSRQVFQATSCIGSELLYIGSSRSSNLFSSMWRGPREYITYEFVLTFPAVSCMSGLSHLDSFRDGWLVALQLLFCRVLTLGFVRYYLQQSCIFAVKLFLHTFS